MPHSSNGLKTLKTINKPVFALGDIFLHYYGHQFILNQFKFNTPVRRLYILLSMVVYSSILKIVNALITVTVLETFTIYYIDHLY